MKSDKRECEERVRLIAEGFQQCRSAFTAIGDETRQLILQVLLESDLNGIRVGEIAAKTHLTRPSVFESGRDCRDASGRNKELLLLEPEADAVEGDSGFSQSDLCER